MSQHINQTFKRNKDIINKKVTTKIDKILAIIMVVLKDHIIHISQKESYKSK